MGQQDDYQTVYENIPCGVFEYWIGEQGITFEHINAAGLQMFGYQRDEFEAKSLWTNEDLVHEEDIPLIEKLVGGLLKVGDVGDFTYRMMRKDGTWLWVRGTLCLMDVSPEGNLYQSACVDIDDQKRTEQTLLLNQEKMEIALANSNISLWDYELATRICIRRDPQRNLFGTPFSTTPEEMVATGRIHPDHIQKCLSLFDAIDSGESFASVTIPIKSEEGAFRYVKMCLRRNLSDPIAVGWTEDIDASVRNQQRLAAEIKQQEEATSKTLLSKARFNLTDQIMEHYYASENAIVGNLGQSYEEWCSDLLQVVVSDAQKQQLEHMLDRKTILADYEAGDSQRKITYQRRLRNGRQLWVSTSRHVYLDSETGKMILFLYSTDVTDDVLFREMVRRVSHSESEMLAVLYPEQNIFRLLFSKISNTEDREADYTESCGVYIDKNISEYYREEAYEAFSIQEICQQLEKNDVYSITFLVEEAQKTVRKKWNFYYLDEARTIIVVKRSDITEIFAQQQKQREAIESALLSAKQANSAKSNFLSRMSHEIRTPLNAILGMCALAAQSIGNDREVADCISKIGISGHYLLSLINDILDMSRIESGKMLLQKEPFRMDEFISNINTVIYGQTREKKIDYETLIDPNLEDVYVGDAMKLQQILVNVLGNAVKFTPEGGKISFGIHAGPIKKQIQKISFTVNDTGSGIEEEAMERIFEPFEQQDGSTTREYGGSGLGLSICKNLTELMSGTIQCKSIVGIGTEFIVSIPLTVSETRIHPVELNYSFEKMRALIVDDDITICESTSRTLKDMGLIPEWVSSGMEAVERVQALLTKKKSYDYILIDWKMPEMDGIETTRRIRKLVGPEVTIIIITAYDWISIEREAKLAGANLCISKPMFKSTLVSAFQRSISQKEELEEPVQISYDFTGIRVLLAEDHPMNAEIARKLLEHKNCQVEVAENGLKAMEFFTTKPVGYYQAILMDVRMPIMDGLQASTNIRRWNKEDAKKIPIIAMTANAFDEDVEKCLAAGMNAHLAKPIDPDLLYRTLNKYIEEQK